MNILFPIGQWQLYFFGCCLRCLKGSYLTVSLILACDILVADFEGVGWWCGGFLYSNEQDSVQADGELIAMLKEKAEGVKTGKFGQGGEGGLIFIAFRCLLWCFLLRPLVPMVLSHPRVAGTRFPYFGEHQFLKHPEDS